MQFHINMGGKSAQQVINEEKESKLLEPGLYEVALVRCERTEKMSTKTKGRKNIGLKMTFAIQAGKRQGFTLTKFIGIDHETPSYEASSRAFIAGLALALSIEGFVGDIDPMMNKLVSAKVKIKVPKDPNDQYGPQNEIEKFFPADAVPAATPGGGWAPKSAPAPTQASAAPAQEALSVDPAPASTVTSGGNIPAWKRHG